MDKKSDTSNKKNGKHREHRHLIIFGYTKSEIQKVLKHFEAHLPDFVKLHVDNSHLVTKVTLTGEDDGVELLRFMMNRLQSSLAAMFSEETITAEDKSIAEVLGDLLTERDLTVSCAESCTGGNIAHRIVQVPGSSNYFLGSVVSYSNDVKADVLKVPRNDIARHGAVSSEVAEAMAKGVAKLMHTDCAIATTGVAGPDGGTKLKPVGTVWIAAKYGDRVVSEVQQFQGDRNAVIESATNHGMVMLIKLLRNSYEAQEDFNDE